MDFILGRREPSDWGHIKRFPYSALQMPATPATEKILVLPSWHSKHNQGKEGACVGFGTSMMLSIINEDQVRRQGIMNPYIRYNPFWLWNRAKEIDEWPDTLPGDSQGTSVKAAIEILIKQGHVLWTPNEDDPDSFGEPATSYGVNEVRWAQTIEEIRSAIALGIPISMGVNWYNNFFTPEYYNNEYWIGREGTGLLSGGHCVCLYGMSDERQAFRLKNSWGPTYPECWISYEIIDRLIRENGEFAVVIDRM